jgi:hypothetical protein
VLGDEAFDEAFVVPKRMTTTSKDKTPREEARIRRDQA